MKFTTNTILVVACAALPSAMARDCGFKIAPCPDDQVCIPVDPFCSDTVACMGTCEPKITEYQSCGGFRPPPVPRCPKGTTCRDDPRVPGCGMACDRPGICIPDNAPVCHGFAGFQCPVNVGLECYDLPNDGCDPDDGGSDCIGVCLAPLKPEEKEDYGDEDD